MTVAGTTYATRLLEERPDSLVGLVGFEDPLIPEPDTLRIAWSDISRVELRAPAAGQNAAVLVAGAAGAVIVYVLVAKNLFWCPEPDCKSIG